MIDFGELGVGDPACDMLPAWALLDGRARASFRGEVDVDDATWERGRGWALALGVGAVDVYHWKPRGLRQERIRDLGRRIGP